MVGGETKRPESGRGRFQRHQEQTASVEIVLGKNLCLRPTLYTATVHANRKALQAEEDGEQFLVVGISASVAGDNVTAFGRRRRDWIIKLPRSIRTNYLSFFFPF